MRSAEAELTSWLASKRWAIDAARDCDVDDGKRALQILHHDDGKSKSLRARLIERETPTGTYTTELLAHDRRGEGDWVRIHVANDQGGFVDVPRVARRLMQALPLSGSTLQFEDRAQVFNVSRTDELLDILCDDERIGLVLVAGTDATSGIPFDSFVQQMNRWTKEVFGLAQVIVLDPTATRSLRDQFDGHAVDPWTIRTYYPGVDPASIVDARRHKILSTARLADEADPKVVRLLGRVARIHASRYPAPAEVIKLRRAFQRLENRLVVEALPLELPPTAALQQTAPPEAELTSTLVESPDATTAAGPGVAHDRSESSAVVPERDTRPDSVAERLHADLIRALSRLERAEAQLELLQERAEAAEDDLAVARRLLEDGQVDRAILQDASESLAARVKWLQSELAQREARDIAYGDTPQRFSGDYPDSFDSLLDRTPELAQLGIVLTCSPAEARALDENDTLNSAVRTTWDALTALADYLRARSDGKGVTSVDRYLRSTPAGYATFPVGKHAYTETGTTMKRWKDERLFPVPTSVDESGSATMTAHFKLAQIGMVSPRMYYLDRSPLDGKIYVGYIGPHLTNTQTN